MSGWLGNTRAGVVLLVSAVLLVGTTTVASGAPAANVTPTTILGEGMSFVGAIYGGVVTIPTSGGPARALKVLVNSVNLRGVQVSLPRENGRATRLTASTAKLSSGGLLRPSTLYLRQLKGKINLGPIKIPVDVTPDNPLPLPKGVGWPWASLSDVTIGVYLTGDTDLSLTGLRVTPNARHIPLPEPTMIPPPPVGGGAADGGVPADCAQVTGPVGVEATTLVEGIRVHYCLASGLRRLLSDASTDGVRLNGWGYRSYLEQVELRKAHCGTSAYAIYQMPADQCSPPTAPPGSSMHERGLAIDFTYGGRIIGSRSGPAWNWLVANAADYGLRNLPSEPWHWSTNGH